MGTCTSATAGLWCSNGTVRGVFCNGPAGCTEEGDRIQCDQSVAQDGDLCVEGRSSCDASGTQQLSCVRGEVSDSLHFRAHAYCRGPAGCVAEGGGRARCDQPEPIDAAP